VRRDRIEADGGTWSEGDEEAFKDPIRATYEAQGNPYHATARLWDDGLIEPAATRDVVGLGLAVATGAPIGPVRRGVLRM
jgi:3-methylcrotonyl-CoA carboxylase beta subunit